MSCTLEEKQIIQKYVYLCENPLRTHSQIVHEYIQLKQNPNITHIAFYRPEVLMVGTKPVIISFAGKRYMIGEFIIFLVRHKVGSYWEVDFRFWNVTNPLPYDPEEKVESSEVAYIHPHIMPNDRHELIECPNGRMCIQQGQFEVYQYLRKGEMHHAAQRLFEILHVYPTGHPYHDVTNWPILGEK